MEGLRRLGHESLLIARTNEMFISKTRDMGFPVHVIRKPFLLHGGILSGFDVIHAHETRGIQLAVAWKPIHGRPIVATRRIDTPPSHNPLTRLIYSRLDSLAAVSEKVKSVMNAWEGNSRDIMVIPDSIDMNRHLSDSTLRTLKDRFRSMKVIGCIAALEKRKDHITLLKAASLIQEKRQDVVFVFIGDGDLREELERQAKELHLHNVIFEGYQDDPYPYYPIFDVFVLTSREEGLGSSILDAFFYHVPVVATAAGGIPELVKNGETGLLSGVGDYAGIAGSLLKMLDDTDFRTYCTTNAYGMLAERFSIEAMARSYEGIYLGLI
jgi:glycosyltransferase involved in cell wall biosynthesis